jgi:hypothetical protein
MTWKEWCSNESAWAILRRGIVMTGIALLIAVPLHLVWQEPSGSFLFFIMAWLPLSVTALNLFGFYVKKIRRGKEQTA